MARSESLLSKGSGQTCATALARDRTNRRSTMADDVLRDSQARPVLHSSCRWLETDYSMKHLRIHRGFERLEQSTDWPIWDFSLGAKEAIKCQT
ncbi:uncharacterized [Tachysurus ichikawai]